MATSTLKNNADAGITLYHRNGANPTLITSVTNPPYAPLPASGAITGFRLADNTAYTGMLSASLSATGVVTVVNSYTGGLLSGVSFSTTDTTTSPTVSFDTLTLALQSVAASSISFSNISVSVAPTATGVPEPTTLAFLSLALLPMVGYKLSRKRPAPVVSA